MKKMSPNAIRIGHQIRPVDRDAQIPEKSADDCFRCRRGGADVIVINIIIIDAVVADNAKVVILYDFFIIHPIITRKSLGGVRIKSSQCLIFSGDKVDESQSQVEYQLEMLSFEEKG